MVVSSIFYFHPYLGKVSNLINMFPMGLNHQLVYPQIDECIAERNFLSKSNMLWCKAGKADGVLDMDLRQT